MLGLVLVLAMQLGDPSSRAVRNYEAVARGQIPFSALTPLEQQEVREADRIFRARQKGLPTWRERCIAQQKLAGDTPTRLEQATIDLKCGK
ncbi:hypothetical protein [Sphingomonas jatrophae]|uniref:Uncharacterized protein n=1 Tax=Sphingomonas jatrophae TaxID=1166337 RepID=A0A1I6LD37_9SPHN|nr:hypothetical protein [Sphingomonas jatrophae]SFS01353.1 hypothetical protein SAMN05192580_2591 [Sphingomonas jatrophae]